MKIPVVNGPKVESRPIGTSYSNLDNRTGLEDVAKGVGQLAGGLTNVIEESQRADARKAALAERAKKQADDFRIDEADLRFGHRINELLHEKDTGFLNQQGERALDEQPTMKEIDTAYRAISKDLANDEQRKAFELKAASRTEQTWATIEKHVAGQRMKVYEGVAQGQVGLALDTAGLSYADPRAVDSAIGKVLINPDGGPGPLRRYLSAQGLPAEKIDAEEAAFQAKAYGVALQGYLDHKDADGAERYFNAIRPKLGNDAGKFEKVIATLKNDQEAEKTAAILIETGREPNGRVSIEKVQAAIDAVPEGPLRDEVRQRTEQRLTVATREWKQQVDGHYEKAFSAYLGAGNSLSAIDSQDKAWLIQNAPDEWQKILSRNQANIEHARVGRERGASKETDAQRDALIDALADIEANPEEYSKKSSAEFTAQWGHQLSDAGFKQAGRLFASKKKEPAGSSAEFTRFVADEVRGNDALRKNKKAADQYRAFMGDQRRAFKEKNNGREPGPTDFETMRDAAWATTVEKGWLWGTNTSAPAFKKKPEPGPTEKPKVIKKYQRSKDGTRRRPVYEDGTFGPEEQVR